MPVVLTDPLANNKTVVLSSLGFQNATLEAANDQVANPAVNALNDSTFDYWGQSGSMETRLRKVGGIGLLDVNACGVSGHNLGTTGSTFFVRYSDNGTTWSNATPSYAPLTDEDIFFIFPRRAHLYWELAFGGSSGAYVSNVKMGLRLDFPCTPIEGYRPVHHSRKYTKYFNNSIEGHLLGNRVMASGGTTTVDFPDLDRNFVDGPMQAFESHYNIGRSFFYAGWPNGKPQDVAYAWADGEDAMIDVSYTHGSKRASVAFGMSIKYGR